ncbi:MAG: hypothetical protein LEGION0398_MBIBDBAK_01389 [Legionellaceae bacterium]
MKQYTQFDMIIVGWGLAAAKAFSSMKRRLGSTSSPIKVVKIWSAENASSIVTKSMRLVLGSIVVSHSCSGFISPKPL